MTCSLEIHAQLRFRLDGPDYPWASDHQSSGENAMILKYRIQDFWLCIIIVCFA
jgi:hypothetical protein